MTKFRTWIPNIFTLGNLSLGFFSILLSMQAGENPDILTLAGWFILLAALCDGLDGFAARLLNASSELGAHLDSLADLSAFGIAPGVLMYSLILHEFNLVLDSGAVIPAGMFLAAIFPICAAYRLARFNVDHSPDCFRGLPSPIAGVIVGIMPLAFTKTVEVSSYILILVFVVSAFLMVSTVKYAKPQVSALSWFSPFRLAFLLLFIVGSLVLIGIRYNSEFAFVGLFFLLVVYILSGIVSLAIQLIQNYRM